MVQINGEEYMENAQGAMIPITSIKEIDLLRNEIVIDLVVRAFETSNKIKDFKEYSFNEIAEFIKLSAEQYGAKIGGKKGNTSLVSYDGKYKITRSYADNIVFDERLMAAKALIDECIHEWSNGANDKIVTLVNHAFQTDNEGKVSTSKVLGLKRLKINDEKWLKAMLAISDSINITNSKGYLRFYVRVGDSDQYKAIPINIAEDF